MRAPRATFRTRGIWLAARLLLRENYSFILCGRYYPLETPGGTKPAVAYTLSSVAPTTVEKEERLGS